MDTLKAVSNVLPYGGILFLPFSLNINLEPSSFVLWKEEKHKGTEHEFDNSRTRKKKRIFSHGQDDVIQALVHVIFFPDAFNSEHLEIVGGVFYRVLRHSGAIEELQLTESFQVVVMHHCNRKEQTDCHL